MSKMKKHMIYKLMRLKRNRYNALMGMEGKVPRKLKKKLKHCMGHLYILKNGKPRAMKNDPAAIVKWARKFGTGRPSRRVASDKVGELWVSTVFLGTNYAFDYTEPPVLFETMVFGGDKEICRRYRYLKEALRGHREVVEMVRTTQDDQD